MSRRPMWALLVLLAACVPKVTPPRSIEAQIALPADYGGAPAAADTLALETWDALFDDPHLVALIGEALTHNQELGLRLAEMDLSHAELVERRGEVLPRVDLAVGAGVERVGLYTSQGASDASTEITPGREVPEDLGDLHAGLRASWEVDIYKRLRNQSKAARLRYLSSIEGRNFVVTEVVAEVATDYFELLALDNELAVVRANIALQQDGLAVVKLQKEAAQVTELAVQRFTAELLKNQSRQYEILQEIVETENHLNVVCGRYPQPLARSSELFATLSPTAVLAGMPTQLLEHRPDIRAAELDLEAANLEVKAARALFYPSLSLDAEVGVEAFAASLLTGPEALMYAGAGGLLAPLFNRKAIKANYFSANARQIQAVITYERAVLRAYVEVSNQLALIDNLDHSYALRTEQVAQLEQAIETSNRLFRSARADYLEVLTTRREALESQIEQIETKKAQLTAMVDAYQALGGGWRAPTEATP